ncbi:hypothetical protein HC031_13655 [Planosporangium thailandense]|uniref:CBM6 domain-containing protein n=1 Tax=Planosporangium thailandense TaxID=765197 RepID=A0ABX0XZU0_9ACTN|nr:hypothetical protein [Planosporangium thailandense]NJC70752.1 hypothetical protein [Planosporangium thailandense]
MTTEPTTGPSDDAVARHRRGVSLRERMRSRRLGIGVATVLAVAAGATGLVALVIPTAIGGRGPVPRPGVSVSDVAAPWLLPPTDAFGASPPPGASRPASPPASATAAPSSAAATPSAAPSTTGPRATPTPTPTRTPTPGPVAGAFPASYEAEGPGGVRSAGTRLRRVRGASGGYVVGDLGRGETVTFTVTAPTGGRRLLTIYYISADRRTLTGRVNGGRAISGPVPTTPDWYTVGSVTIPVDLAAGRNTIELGGSRGYAPDIDRIVVR